MDTLNKRIGRGTVYPTSTCINPCLEDDPLLPMIFLRSLAQRSLLPCIIATRMDMQATAHPPNRILQTMLCDKRVSHLASLTKYPRPLIKGWVIAIYGRLTLPLFAPLGQRHNVRRLNTSNSIVYAGLIGGWRQPTGTFGFQSRLAGASTS